MAKILLFSANSCFGAVEETYCAWMAQGFHQRGHTIHVMAPQALLDSPFLKLHQGYVEAFHVLPTRPLKQVPALLKTMYQNNFQVVHSLEYNTLAPLVSTLHPHVRYVMTVHTPATIYKHNLKSELMRQAMVRLKFKTVVLTESNKDLAIVNYGFHPDNLAVVVHGFPAEQFKIALSKSQCRKLHNIPKNSFVIGTACRLAKQKALHRMLALAHRLQDLPHVRVIIAGEGECRDELEQQAKSLGLEQKVIFAGFIKPIEPYLKALDIFMLTSDFEGLPAAGMEAFGMGIPVVGTKVAGLNELIGDEQAGSLFSPHDLEQGEAILRQYIFDTKYRKAKSQAALVRFEQNFCFERMINKMEDLYFH